MDFKNAHRETRMWKNEGDTTLEPYNPSFHTVYHIVRNPLKHIASFTSHMLPTYEFVFQAMQRLNYRGLPGTSINSLVGSACHFIVNIFFDVICTLNNI